MRISTSTLFDVNVATLNQQQSKLLQINQQIATGRRVLTPADDPAAAARALQVSQSDATNTQYLGNIGTTQDTLSLSETTLQNVTTLIQNMQTTAVHAGNAALSAADRQSLANDLQNNLGQLMSMANAKDAVGNFLFSGFKGNTQPFVNTPTGVQYVGDDGQRLIQVSSNRQLPSSDSGADIFMRIKNGNGTFVTSQTGQSLVFAGSNVLAGATAPAVPINFSATPATFSVDGTAVTVNQNVTVAGTGTGAGTLAAAIQAGLNTAGLTSYSVSAAVGGGLQITHTGSATAVAITGANAAATANGIVNGAGTAGTAATTLANTGSGVISVGSLASPQPTAAQLGNSYQITFSVAAGGATTYSITGTDVTGAALPTAAQPGALPTNVAFTSGQAISFNGIQFDIQGTPANGDTFTVAPSKNESIFQTVTNLINVLKAPLPAGNVASGAQLSAGISSGLSGLNNALNNVLTVRASVGSRLNELTALQTTGSDLGNQFKQTLSQLQDVDYNQAITDLTRQQTMLQAAQKSFLQIQNLSVFNYLP